jgi:hypothetical protein
MAVDTVADLTAVQAAEQVLNTLIAKRAALGDRLKVNSETRDKLSFAAFTEGNGSKAGKQLADLNTEAMRLGADVENLQSAIKEATRRLEAARQDEATAAERVRAQAAREKFGELAHALQGFSDAANALVPAKNKVRAALDALHPTGFGPSDRMVLRWSQRYLVAALQADRDLKVEDAMATADERRWLANTPAAWLGNLQANTARLLDEPPAQAAE